MSSLREEVIEEAEIIKHAGEIPEVALWNSLHYLTEDPEGPKLNLTSQEKNYLKKAVIDRYLSIIKRDLTYENRKESYYRGIERALINWKRLKNFTKKENFPLEPLRKEVKIWLQKYMANLSPEEQEKEKVHLEELKKLLNN
ncbi:hypothetical protein Thein_0399 [Thermodesulfatator indicus DSM 15286]|uniref:Uncharacterized protein n=1 Tax=Thermodesulfatator indicus (strain DSM 15286 / JCM 11887 / CIR29812) TaxID=667014 RepID=F8AAK9_THEID|nr:hypothetical protein [Thermodesulfatator indicus]AEH44281.1 hypothetical protein Thein_0399 [Thermodesulfatator indicus DSM 15286]